MTYATLVWRGVTIPSSRQLLLPKYLHIYIYVYIFIYIYIYKKKFIMYRTITFDFLRELWNLRYGSYNLAFFKLLSLCFWIFSKTVWCCIMYLLISRNKQATRLRHSKTCSAAELKFANLKLQWKNKARTFISKSKKILLSVTVSSLTTI